MNPPRELIKAAEQLGFTFVRRCKHGQIWRHKRTKKRVQMSRAANHCDWRATRGALADLRRAAT